ELADQHEFLAGVVGWAPLIEAGVEAAIERFSSHPKLKGVRHVLQDEPDDDYMLRAEFNQGIACLHAHGLTYDILIFERHLPQTIQFVDRHPHQIFVLDHIAKPRIKDGSLSQWRSRMMELAKRENVWCKLSGMVTEADWGNWKEADLAPYFEGALEAFGADRLMFGSDWPVMLVAAEYTAWRQIVTRAIAQLSAAEQANIMGATATRVYKLDR
ncbi:MAG: amidohydrolase family protein, partial [Bryobacteraceae bacterium]